jgi:hypothetical protein
MTPTALRRDLFKALRRVILGETLIIETRQGEILMTARKPPSQRATQSRERANQPKIPGRIRGSLQGADSALRKHLRLR